MSELVERYQRRALELREQGKTGYECDYCGDPHTVKYAHGTFCAGCGVERLKPLGTCFGIPIYDAKESAELYEISWRSAGWTSCPPRYFLAKENDAPR